MGTKVSHFNCHDDYFHNPYLPLYSENQSSWDFCICPYKCYGLMKSTARYPKENNFKFGTIQEGKFTNHMRFKKQNAGLNKGSRNTSAFQSPIGRLLVGIDWVNAVFRS
ncbi:hypothetical protein L2E82_01914 [Cichorium intybus]|uniref:Uncharacterized protein n=1 Tax=Cichorium intybus TaxID=13427 RepID=A0ACB9H0V6_CICIN|nr:hypothetical protein L2E82_01914 [Cichorium intybus]